VEAFSLAPSERKVVDTGLAVAVPANVAGLVLPRSGWAAKFGVTVVNAPGLIDPGYRGSIQVILLNTGTRPFAAAAGDRIAQLLFTPIYAPEIAITDELPESSDARGFGGFGSSGA
jgi:dUTP pyrophosphatase